MIVEIGDVVRVGSYDFTLFLLVLNVPVNIVCVAFEHESELEMVVAESLIACSDILAEHEAVGNFTLPRPVGVARYIVSLYLNVCSGAFFILETVAGLAVVAVGEVYDSVFVGILRLVLAFALVVFIEKQSVGAMGVVGTEGGITVCKHRRVGFDVVVAERGTVGHSLAVIVIGYLSVRLNLVFGRSV